VHEDDMRRGADVSPSQQRTYIASCTSTHKKELSSLGCYKSNVYNLPME